VILTASILRIYVTWQDTNVKLPDVDTEMLKHVGVPYFPAHKTHRDFFVRNFRKKKW